MSIDRNKYKVTLAGSEEYLNSIIEMTVDAIISANTKGNIISWNKAAEKMFDYTVDEVVGKANTIIIPGQYRETHEKGIQRAVSSGEYNVVGKTVELIGLKKDGSEFPIELSLSVSKVKEEKLFTGIIRDVSERKRLEEEKEKLIRELQAALDEVKALSGLLPICSSCKKIRDDKGYWNQIEAYISERSKAKFSHGICPDCRKELYPEIDKEIREREAKKEGKELDSR